MSRFLLSKVLQSQELLDKIDQYLYNRKTHQFIAHRMKVLTSSQPDNLLYWRFLIRDSKGVKLIFPDNELSGFNFSYFLDDYLCSSHEASTGPLFQEFCIQSLRQNPRIVFNRWYAGNGGLPAYTLINDYLLNRQSNWHHHKKSQYKEDAFFQMFQAILDTGIVSTFYQRSRFWIRIESISTKYASEVIQRLLKYNKKFMLNQHEDNNAGNYDPTYTIQDTLRTLAKNIVNIYQGEIVSDHTNELTKQEVKEYHQVELKKIKKEIKRLLIYLEDHFWDVLESVSFYSQIVKHASLKTFMEIVDQALLHQVFLSSNEATIITLFGQRKRGYCQYLLSHPKLREKIAQIKHNGNSMIEVVGSSRGLSHNIFCVLWDSGLYSHMPYIRNRKSRKIVEIRYNICFRPSLE